MTSGNQIVTLEEKLVAYINENAENDELKEECEAEVVKYSIEVNNL